MAGEAGQQVVELGDFSLIDLEDVALEAIATEVLGVDLDGAFLDLRGKYADGLKPFVDACLFETQTKTSHSCE